MLALSAGSAVAFGAIDGVYVTRGRVSPVYLGDLAAQTALVTGLLVARRQRRRWQKSVPST